MPQWVLENRLFELARSGKRQTHLIPAILIALGIVFVSQFFVLPVIISHIFLYGMPENLQEGKILAGGLSAFEAGLWMTAILISSFIFIYVFVAIWLWFWEGRAFWSIGLEKDHALIKYLRGLFIGLLSFSAVVGLLALMGAVSIEDSNPNLQGINALSGVLIIFIGWVIQGAAEEVLTRGWLMPSLSVRYKPWVGIGVSSLLFAFLHSLNPNLNAMGMLNLVLFGVFAALYALKEGSLWGICAYHSIWNWAQGNFFGFQVSGSQAAGGTLINLIETGNDLITGGGFGPEGGLVVTGVLLISILLLVFWKLKPTEKENVN